MKKFLIILVLLFLINPVFAKVIQCVKKYQIHGGFGTAYDVTPSIPVSYTHLTLPTKVKV